MFCAHNINITSFFSFDCSYSISFSEYGANSLPKNDLNRPFGKWFFFFLFTEFRFQQFEWEIWAKKCAGMFTFIKKKVKKERSEKNQLHWIVSFAHHTINNVEKIHWVNEWYFSIIFFVVVGLVGRKSAIGIFFSFRLPIEMHVKRVLFYNHKYSQISCQRRKQLFFLVCFSLLHVSLFTMAEIEFVVRSHWFPFYRKMRAHKIQQNMTTRNKFVFFPSDFRSEKGFFFYYYFFGDFHIEIRCWLWICFGFFFRSK